jgi:D-alanyl-D-alanine dipeptidase
VEAAAHLARLRAASSTLEAAGLVGLVVPPSPDLAYLIGYAPMPMERPTALVIVPGQAPILVVPTLERALAARCPAAEGLDIVDWGDGEEPYRLIADLVPSRGIVAAGDRLWGSHLLALQVASPSLRWTAAGAILGPLRARKDPQELGALRRAAAGADAALAELLATPIGGRRETEVARMLADLLLVHGHASAAFTIVASGPNAASPHHEATDRILGAGDGVVLDFGGDVDGYYSDTTRTIVVGAPSPELREIHRVVRDAHTAATAAIRPGVEIREIDRAARGVIEAAGYGEAFIHRTGHGIGLEVHEPPYATEGDDTVLAPGMTFSVEPGIYLPGVLGVRIEDIVAVTDDGVDVLNASPRELLVVG